MSASRFRWRCHTKLNKVTGSPWLALFVSFGGALLISAAFWAAGVRGRGSVSAYAQVPWWAYLSGAIGVVIVVGALEALPLTSAGLVVAVLVFGQGVASLVLDHYGWLDVKRTPINPWRVAGVVLLMGGVLLMMKE